MNLLPPSVVIEDALVNKSGLINRRSSPFGDGDLEFHSASLSFVAPEKITRQIVRCLLLRLRMVAIRLIGFHGVH